jgi:methylated-DNA-protein-cysteine methyltransferase-like protein
MCSRKIILYNNQMARKPARGQASVTWGKVYRLVKSVPRGRVITYGDIARLARLRGGAREAGHAMAASPNGAGIPWHRVVGAGGKLLIREPMAAKQLRLLQVEGAIFNGHRIDLSACGWKPRRASNRKQKSHKPKKR